MRMPFVGSVEGASPALAASVAGRPLAEALARLHAKDVAEGFVADDLTHLEYYQVVSGDGRVPLFLQYNPARAGRPQGSAPKGECPLDLTRVIRDGRQQYLQFSLNGHAAVALSTPWPFMRRHFTIASGEHEPQSWTVGDAAESRARLGRLISDLVGLAAALPGAVLAWNGENAGATLPHHRHFHCFELPEGHGPLPVQLAMRTAMRGTRAGMHRCGPRENGFPLDVYRVAGGKRAMVASARTLVERWTRLQGPSASANLVAVTEGQGVALYFVPRHRLFPRALGFSALIGSLEVCGSFVVAAESERQALADGRMDYQRLWTILESVRPPIAHRLL